MNASLAIVDSCVILHPLNNCLVFLLLVSLNFSKGGALLVSNSPQHVCLYSGFHS